jgi:SAM-dependent methyltransferase
MGDSASELARELTRSLTDGAPPNIALMRLLLRAEGARDAEQAIEAALRACAAQSDPQVSGRMHEVASLCRQNPGAWKTLRAICSEHPQPNPFPDRAVEDWSAAYDRMARTSPEASVALYSFGNPDLLTAATAEVVAYLSALGFIGAERKLLEIGCGIGRFLEALAPKLALAVGCDISVEMVRHAKHRCGRFSNVLIVQSCGRDLATFCNSSFDVVLAADVFPYIRHAGVDLVEIMLRETARVLRPGGALILFNFSYRGDRQADCHDMMRLSQSLGLTIAQNGARPFKLWDGLAFVIKKNSG